MLIVTVSLRWDDSSLGFIVLAPVTLTLMVTFLPALWFAKIRYAPMPMKTTSTPTTTARRRRLIDFSPLQWRAGARRNQFELKREEIGGPRLASDAPATCDRRKAPAGVTQTGSATLASGIDQGRALSNARMSLTADS